MTDTTNEIQSLVAEVKKTIESKNSESAESKAKVESLEAKIIELENKLAEEKAVATVASESKAALEAKIQTVEEDVKNLSKKVFRSSTGNGAAMDTELKDFAQLLKTNDVKYLRTDRDSDGGYLVPHELYDQIVRKVVEISPMRQLARTVTTSNKSIEVARGDSDMSVFFVSEGMPVTESTPGYGKITIHANKLMTHTTVTNELLADSAWDVVAELNTRAALKFAQREAAAFVNGTGGGSEPEGFLQAAGTLNVNSGHATQLTADAFQDMLAILKQGYANPVFVMNRKTYFAARKLKAGNGEYLLGGGMDQGFNANPNSPMGYIFGVPVYIMQDMPDIGAGNKPIALLCPDIAYMIVDRLGMSVRRDDNTLITQDQVRFVMSRRVGGAVVNPDAVITMTISV